MSAIDVSYPLWTPRETFEHIHRAHRFVQTHQYQLSCEIPSRDLISEMQLIGHRIGEIREQLRTSNSHVSPMLLRKFRILVGDYEFLNMAAQQHLKITPSTLKMPDRPIMVSSSISTGTTTSATVSSMASSSSSSSPQIETVNKASVPHSPMVSPSTSTGTTVSPSVSLMASSSSPSLLRRASDTTPGPQKTTRSTRWSYPGFVGIAALKKRQAQELANLTELAMTRQWESLQTHKGTGFDWWMFPIDQDSSFGDKWRVSPSDIEELRADPAWMASHREGILLVARSWGRDLIENCNISDPKLKWKGWYVRLGKMLCSAYLFKHRDLHTSLIAYIHSVGVKKILPDDRWHPYLKPIPADR